MKNIPHSRLAKLRLFIERDSKSRQITSTVGNTFRNSKWSDYSLGNVSRLQHTLEPNPFLSLTTITFTFLVLSFVVLTNNSIYDLSLFYYLMSFFIELDDWLSFSETWVLALPFFLQAILTNLFNFSALTLVNMIFNLKVEQNSDLGARKDTNSPFFSFMESARIDTNSLANKYNFNFIRDSFQLNSNTKDFRFEFYLFNTTTNHLNTNRPQLTIQSKKWLLTDRFDFLKESKGVNSTHVSSIVSADYKPFSVKTSDSVFYIPSLSYQKLNYLTFNNEFINFSKNLFNQTLVINNLRWSYRYNILHRRSLYNSHKITESKKLLGSGFFTTDIHDTNLWFSDQYSRDLMGGKKNKQLDTLSLIKSNWKLLYGASLNNFSTYTSFNFFNNNNSKEVFNRLSFYESSFHFFLNRTKFYSSLESNIVSSNLSTKQDSLKYTLDSMDTAYKYSLSNLVKDSRFFENSMKLNFSPKSDVVNSESRHLNKDVILVSKDRELFNIRNLEITFNTTRFSPLMSQKLYVFNYKNNSKNSLPAQSISLLPNTSKNKFKLL